MRWPWILRVWGVGWREWLIVVRDPKLSIFVAVVSLLVPLAVHTNARDFAYLRSRVAVLQEELSRTIDIKRRTVTGREIEQTLRIVRQPSGGFVFVTGLERKTPLYWDFGSAGVRVGPGSDAYSAHTSAQNLDIEVIVRIIAGLFALLLGVDALARERQQQSVYGLVSQPISIATIVLAKSIAHIVVLTGLAVWIGTLAWTTARFFIPAVYLSGSMLGLLIVASVEYLSVCFLIGMACSSCTAGFHKAQTAALSVWLLVNVISVPIAGSLEAAIAPQRPRADFENELARTFAATSRESERRLGSELLKLTGPVHWWTLERNEEQRRRVLLALDPIWQDYARHWTSDMAAREAAWHAIASEQDRVGTLISTVAPGLLFYRLAAAACGTGAGAATGWHRAVISHQHTLYDSLVRDRPRLALQVPTDDGFALLTLQRRPDAAVTDLPRFEPPRGDQASATSMYFAMLTSHIVLLYGLTLVLTRRLRQEPEGQENSIYI